jgi:NDP-sugar pyrophosphorylase family protein
MEFLKLPLIAYPLALLEQVGVTETYINTHHLPETVMAAVDPLKKSLKMKIVYSHETPNILDSAGAMDPLRDFLNGTEPFFLVNSDSVVCFKHTRGLHDLILMHKKQNPLATLLTCPHPEVGKKLGGVWVDPKSRIHSIGMTPSFIKITNNQKTHLQGSVSNEDKHQKKDVEAQNTLRPLHYTGFMVLSPKVLEMVPRNQPSHIFKDVLGPAIKLHEKVMSHCEELDWYETGDWESFKAAERECSKILINDDSNAIALAHKIFGISSI